MTPLALELEGFTCYRHRARIDWDEVGTALFAVTGPTGAGKSTLLDAITYVLYGRTARLGGRGLESLISPGADSLYVQLTFRNARGVYRVTRAAQRKSGGSVSTEVRIEEADAGSAHGGWRQLAESERVKDATTALQELVGLDYDGFTRAVLLPQGAFDEFLRGDAAQRRRLLVSLLGLDRVGEIQKLAGQRASLAEEQVKGFKTRLAEDYADVDQAALKALRGQEKALKGEISRHASELREREAELAVVEETARLERERAALLVKRERLQALSPRVKELRLELERGRRAAVLAPQVRQLRAHEGKAGAAERALAVRGEELARAEAALAAAAAGLERAEGAADERRTAIDAELAALAQVRPAHDRLVRLGGSLALAPGAERAELLDEERWSGWQTALSLLPTFENALRERGRRRAQLGKERAALTGAGETLARLAAELEVRLADGKRLRAAEAAAKQGFEEARRADLATTLRAGLAPDDPCPVCGNPVGEHPPSAAHADLTEAEARLQRASAAVEQALEAYNRVKSEHAAAEAHQQGAAARLAEAERGAAAAEGALTAAREELGRHGVTVAAAEVAAADAKAADATAAATAGVAPRLRAELERARAAALAAHARAIAERLTAAGAPADPGLDLERRAASLTAERAALERALKGAEQEQQAAARGRDIARTQLAAAEENLRAARDEAAAAQSALAEALAAAGFADLGEVEGAARDAAELARLETEVTAHASELEGVERRDVELAAALAARPALPAVPADAAGAPAGTLAGTPTDASALAECLKALVGRRRTELDEMRPRLGGLERERADMEGRLARSVELRKQLAAAEDRFDLHRQLALDLRGNNFPDHLMTQVQQRLARRASAILRHVTDGRYDLHLADGDYLVADAWAGGELRSARTLSGGESFVASLALALALSDTLAGNAALGALFLDEGFGTLDRETLEAVTGVLESLTDEGRMVGVITHVPELSERLPARLVVTKGPGGSTVAWDA